MEPKCSTCCAWRFYPGTRCVAAPAFDDSGRVVAAMSVSCLITHLTEDRMPDLAALVLDAAGHLSEQLGYCKRDAILSP